MDAKALLEAIGQMIDAKLAQQKAEILDEAAHRMKVLLDVEVATKFTLWLRVRKISSAGCLMRTTWI